MKIDQRLNDAAVLGEIGGRLAQARLAQNVTQRALGERAGVARDAIQRLEAGEPVTTLTLVRVLRALDLLEELDAAVPVAMPSPIAAVERASGRRRRASHAADRPAEQRPWRWGDER